MNTCDKIVRCRSCDYLGPCIPPCCERPDYDGATAEEAWQAALQHSHRETSQDAEDAKRYRWLREHGFNHADVELTSDLDGNHITIWRLRFYIPEPSGLPYEEDEWTLEQLDAAIDHARRVEGGNHE